MHVQSRRGLQLFLALPIAAVLLVLSFHFLVPGALTLEGVDPVAALDEAAPAQHQLDLSSLLVSPYLARPTGQRADPVNLIFVGTSDAGFVARVISDTMGWRDNDGGTMFFAQRGEPAPHDKQVTSATVDGKRYHIRLKAGVGEIEGQPFVLGAIHMDYTVTCGHVGRAFDGARDTLMSGLRNQGFESYLEMWDIIEPATHCDGSNTMSDGQIAIIEFPAAMQ